ncbi:hypothetical protein FE257_008136 [Aspergillus nanangensis]|uniref:Transcription factor domain-containing protein n=1 Tax=Aspergillus nanangensis TaxID=2582783 RepID=A0AAD4CM16_ASPNN|nr:hypothetical protein FE257_008136 [Aspergillus nanangensis]
MHKAARAPHAQGFAESIAHEARKCIRTSNIPQDQVNNIQIICVLIEYEASQAHGRQAWIDIGETNCIAPRFVQLAISDFDFDSKHIDFLAAAERYLCIAQASHSLGHRHLQPSDSRPGQRPRLDYLSCPEECPHLVELLEVLACIYQLCLTPFSEQNPLPWTAESKFQALQDELEEYLLRHPNTFFFGSNTAPSHDPRPPDMEVCVSSMIWHCCVIVLNRIFLPIPDRGHRIAAEAGQEPADRYAQFPKAPPLFLKEKSHRCASSADAICDISRDIIRNGGFYSVTSALISVNRLALAPKPYDDRVVESMQLSYVVLGALGTFYAPAKYWIEVLVHAHDTKTLVRHLSEPVDMLFTSYFSRFVDIEEPVFMPLDLKGSGATLGDTQTSNELDQMTDPRNKSQSQSEGSDTRAPASTVPEWLQAYTGHLSGDIDSDDEHNSVKGSPHRSAVDMEPQPAQEIPISTFDEGQDIMNLQLGDWMTADADQEFLALFDHMPTFDELNPGMHLFPALGSLMNGANMWSDMLTDSTSK